MRLSPAGVRLCPVVQRYAWPSELDRWVGEPFGSASRLHVSVYGR